MSYFCENDPSFAQFPCGVRVLATANRPNVPDVIIAFVPDITLYGNHIIGTSRLIGVTVKDGSTVRYVSTVRYTSILAYTM